MDILSSISFLISAKNELFNEPKTEKYLKEILNILRSTKNTQINKQLLYELKEQDRKDKSQFRIFIDNLVGEINSLEKANRELINFSISNKFASKVSFTYNDYIKSSTGITAYYKELNDGKTAIVYHTKGKYIGELFTVRWGIGWYYRKFLGPKSFLGLPTSSEFIKKHNGKDGSVNYFEKGMIEYIKNENKIIIYKAENENIIIANEHYF